MDNVLSVSRSRWRSVASTHHVSRVFDYFNLACSVLIVPMRVSAATKPVRVSAASNMAFKTAVSMAFAKSARKASNVALTSARTRVPTAIQRDLLSVRTADPLFSNARLSRQVSPAANGEPEWQATNGTPQTPTGGQSHPPIQAIPHYPPPPEGFYPYFYPPPPGFIAPGHEGQSPPEGGTNGTSHHPIVPYYPLAPPGFFSHYAASVTPSAFPPPANGTPATTIDPAEASRNVGQSAEAEGQTNGTAATGKKRSRAGKGEAKPKKQKAAATIQEGPTSGGTVGGSDHASEPGANSPPDHDD